jgi:hypothetical protein
MAEDGSSDCEIVPTGDGRTFHFRVRLSSHPPAKPLQKRTRLAGCRCSAVYSTTLSSPDEIDVTLRDRLEHRNSVGIPKDRNFIGKNSFVPFGTREQEKEFHRVSFLRLTFHMKINI